MIKQFIFLFCLLILPSFSFAADIYVAQSSSGSANGVDCNDANALSWFNTSGNWANPKQAGKIGPGDTVHLCGTFTASAGASGYITIQNSGSGGSPITILFESGAIVQAPYWGANGAIYMSGKSYITVDGGTNGLIQATLNGTSGGTCPGGTCQYQQQVGEGIYLPGCSNIEVKNLTIGDLYDHTSITDTTSSGLHNPWAIGLWSSGTNITIHNNTFHDVNWAISIQAMSTISGVDINSNNIYNVSVGVAGGDGGSGAVISNVNIYNNTIHDMTNWDANGDVNHHDGVYIWLTNASSSFTGFYNLYNNYIYNLGTTCSTGIYFDSGASSTYPNGTAFNNIINAGTCGDGAIYDKSGKMKLYNNTILVGTMVSIAGNHTTVLENNISLATEGIWFTSATISVSNYNDWYGLGNPAMTYNNTAYSTLAAYKSATGFDSNSITSNPNLDSNYAPNAGSPVIGAGVNLYSICNGQPNPGLGALCYDKAGNSRPQSTAWDIGAYQYGTLKKPMAPSSLRLIP